MEKKKLLYEGKAKRVYLTADPNVYLMEFKDEATAFDGLKKDVLPQKGFYNAQISALLFRLLAEAGVPNHFLGVAGERELYVRALKIIPLEVVMRNRVAGSMAKRLGIEEGMHLARPVLEFYYKSDALHDPLVNEDHILALGWAEAGVLEEIKGIARRTNEVLRSALREAGLDLIDFKLEFGFNGEGKVVLGDEISPDTCRFWDVETEEKLDKDRFRRDLGDVTGAYAEVLRRLEACFKQS